MVNACVVPGCKSNYRSAIEREGYVQAFLFPSKNADLYCAWVRAIPRVDWTPNDSSMVCIKHFIDDDLLFVEHYKDREGKIREFKRSRPVLKEGAIPQLFPDLSVYLNDSRNRPSSKLKELIGNCKEEESKGGRKNVKQTPRANSSSLKQQVRPIFLCV